MKYAVYCDMSTLKCDFKQFNDFLHTYTEDVDNIDNSLWLVDIDSSSSPIYNDLSDIVSDLEAVGYADKDSHVCSIEYSSLSGRFFGVDKSIHVDGTL